MDNLLVKSKEFFLDLFFPKFCLGCKKEGNYLCQDCRTLLDISQYHYCLCDIKPLRLPDANTGKCARCQDKKLSGLYSALPYQERSLTRKLIYQFKYQPYLKDLAKTLASLVVEHLFLIGANKEDTWQNAVLVPIPLDKRKLKLRSYNQAEELAKELSHVLQIPVISRNLVKVIATKPQMELSRDERAKNVENAFAIKNPATFAGKKVFLVDDVYTTGFTMQSCAVLLKEAKAKSVWGISIAREG